VEELLNMGCYEVSLGDTLGVGTPHAVQNLIKFLKARGIPLDRLAGHFHDTYGQALANVWEAYSSGISVFDSSVAGLGGCPFAPGAKGNLATEDLVYMFDQAGVSTGVDLAKLVATGTWISDKLSRRTESRAGAALAIKHGVAKKATETPRSVAKLVWTRVKETDGLLLDRSGANLRVTMNRPKNGNTLTTAMIEHLISAIIEAGKNESINRVVITGNGKFFCTGMDLSKDTPVGGGGSSSDLQYERLTRLFDTIDQCPKTTIACLNGPAFGGGVGLAFACDLRLCTKSAKITLSEAKLGLCPATISKFIVREFGVAFAREAMLTARPISPAELKLRGIVADVADDTEKLNDLLDSLLSNLRGVSPDASRMCKSLVQAGWIHGGQGEQVRVMKEMFTEMMAPTSAGSFGVKEFQAGRKVDWDKNPDLKPHSKL
jgi:hydroxymethylglutaryl-CoA lyase